jgi:hypothetical protein
MAGRRRTFYVLHDLWKTMSKYKRGRGRKIIGETIAGWTQFQGSDRNYAFRTA